MYTISKSFEFDYGHRVWTQELDAEYSIDTSCKCRWPHGHRGRVIVHLSDENLNSQGMVTDFKHLNWFKRFLDDRLDHKFLMDMADPLRKDLYPISMDPSNLDVKEWDCFVIRPERYENLEQHTREWMEGLVLVPFVPTSENICNWFYRLVQKKMEGLNVIVKKVEFYETPKSRSEYAEDID